MEKNYLKDRLADKILEANIVEQCDMSAFTSFRAGGKADVLVIPQNREELKFALAVVHEQKVPYMVMGNGSNILVKDGGYPGVIIKLGEAFSEVRIEGDLLAAECGTLMSVVAREAMEAQLTGFEFASGIPGSIGGAAFMNAGAYGGEMVQIVKEVTVISKDGSKEFVMPCNDMDLSYRHSIFHQTGDVIVEVVMQLKSGNKSEISKKMKELSTRRNEKQPVAFPSAGSFFKRPEGYFAGKLIQDAGLKGLSVGGAQISTLHSGFLINTGNASATDIIQLMEIVQAAVLEKFGVKMEPEVRIIGE